MIVGILVLPEEGNVKDYVDENVSLEGLPEYCKVWVRRSFDIPAIVNALPAEKLAIGITGLDYYVEYLLKKPNNELKAIRTLSWYREDYKFGYPTLCLLGPIGKKLKDLPKEMKICINEKWYNIADLLCLQGLMRKGYTFYKIERINGKTEEMFGEGAFDLVVEVVGRGNSAKLFGLETYSVIFKNKGVVVFGNKQNYLNKKLER